jgi:hypothetical protein
LAMGNRFISLRPGVLRPFMALLICYTTVLAGQTETKSTELRIPRDPDPPAVDIKEKDKGKPEDNRVTVETMKGEPMEGSLILDFDLLDIEVMDGGAARKESIPLAGIDSIEFIQWRGSERRKNEFAFYPIQTRIIMKDKKVYICGRNIPKLNRLMIKSAKGSRIMFSYFYDYRKNNAWKNSGEADMSYPETHPSPGTLVRIIFSKTENKNWLERLLLH